MLLQGYEAHPSVSVLFISVSIPVPIIVLSLHKIENLKVIIKLSSASCYPGKAESCQEEREMKLDGPNSPIKKAVQGVRLYGNISSGEFPLLPEIITNSN